MLVRSLGLGLGGGGGGGESEKVLAIWRALVGNS